MRPDVVSVTRTASRSVPACAVEDEVVVVALAELDLLVVGVDARADGSRLAEVERRARDRPQLAGRDQRRVHRRVPVGVDHDLVRRGCPRRPARRD